MGYSPRGRRELDTIAETKRAHMYVYLYVYIHMYVYLYVYVHMYVYLYVYIHMYVWFF